MLQKAVEAVDVSLSRAVAGCPVCIEKTDGGCAVPRLATQPFDRSHDYRDPTVGIATTTTGGALSVTAFGSGNLDRNEGRKRFSSRHSIQTSSKSKSRGQNHSGQRST